MYGYFLKSDNSGIDEKLYANVSGKCINSNLDVHFDPNIVAIKVKYKGEGVNCTGLKTVYLKPHYYQRLDVHNHSGVDPALDDNPTDIIEYGMDCSDNDCAARTQFQDAPVKIHTGNSGIVQKVDLTFFDKDKKQISTTSNKPAAGQWREIVAPKETVYVSAKTV